MGETNTYTVVGSSGMYSIEAHVYRTDSDDGTLMFFGYQEDEPVAKFPEHEWRAVFRPGTTDFTPEHEQKGLAYINGDADE